MKLFRLVNRRTRYKESKCLRCGFGQLIFDTDPLDEIQSPHVKRYYYALGQFAKEVVGLLERWQLGVSGSGQVYLELPPDKDGGIFLKKDKKGVK